MNSIGHELSQSIKESKWVAIRYRNENKGITSYWISILNIDPETRRLKVEMYNHPLGDDVLSGWIYFDKIEDAKMLDFTTAQPTQDLIKKIESNLHAFTFMQYDGFNNDILSYLLECYRLDNDPTQDKKASILIPGIDVDVLLKNKKVVLNSEQIDKLYNLINEKDYKKLDVSFNEFVISRLSICASSSQEYIYVYQKLAFDPKTKSLSLVDSPKINQAFIVDGKRHSLSNYTELSASEFEERYNENPEEAVSIIREAADSFHEQISTRPNILILTRNISVNLSTIFDKINTHYAEKRLAAPLKAFFGNLTSKDNGRNIPQIVLYDKRVNADQMLVLYNAMKNPVTYVQGPPGTGKTQTLFNVVLSCYFKESTTLVTTMNNKPVDDIIKKIKFSSPYGDIPFPFLRLGNKEVMIKATLRIRSLFEAKFHGTPDSKKIEAIKANTREKNKKVSELLTNYERKKMLLQQKSFFEKIKGMNDDYNSRLEDAIKDLNNEIKSIKTVSDDEIVSYFNAASEDPKYLQYLYFSSIAHILKLRNPEYQELRKIVNISDDEERGKEFTKWIRLDENIKLLTDVFPIIFCTNISSYNLGTGEFLFDTVIMDEAGQCNLALSLIPISKAKSLVLVGDEDQLQPVVILLASTNQKLIEKYSVSPKYNYCTSSIITTMENVDQVSKKIILRYHYRCGKRIINFSNACFYENKLIVPESQKDGYLALYDCKNNYKTTLSNQAYEEAIGIVNYIKNHGVDETVIITPFVNQAHLINSLLKSENITSVQAATIHSVQGNEAKTVLLSAAISPRSAKRTVNWLNTHKEIVNVAISRAKNDFILFCDKDSFSKLSEPDSVWSQLIKYTESKGNCYTIKPIPNTIIGKSNGSINEDEFFKTLSHIASVHNAIKVERNVLLRNIFRDDKELENSDMEFDSIISIRMDSSSGFVRRFAFEFQGGEHVFDEKRAASDRKKMDVCKRHGMTFFAIPNSYAKEYMFFIALLKKYAHESMSEGEQLSLF